MSFWERVKGFFVEPLGAEQESTEEPSPLEQVLHPLDVLRHQALQAHEHDAELHERQHTDEEKAELRQKQEAILQDILQLHQKLQTGLSLKELRQMSDALRKHCQTFQGRRSDELNEMAMRAVMSDFHRRALEWGWDDFETRLNSAGLQWPEPTGLSPHAEPEEVERHREYHHQELRKSFVEGSIGRFPDLMVGVVPAWRHLYPTEGGPVWTTSVYEAVAAALACRRLHLLEKIAEQEQDALEKLVATTLARELEPVQEQLRAGVGSIAEAKSLSEKAVGICRRVAPQVVWAHLKPRLGES